MKMYFYFQPATDIYDAHLYGFYWLYVTNRPQGIHFSRGYIHGNVWRNSQKHDWHRGWDWYGSDGRAFQR
jgi:hypothetical protein